MGSAADSRSVRDGAEPVVAGLAVAALVLVAAITSGGDGAARAVEAWILLAGIVLSPVPAWRAQLRAAAPAAA